MPRENHPNREYGRILLGCNRTNRAGVALTLGVILLSFPAYAGPIESLVFADITGDADVGMPGVLTESLAWGDYDNDGDQDVYFTNNGANVLFRNDGGGDADLEDFAVLASCLAGPMATAPPDGCTPEQFDSADLDANGHVDLAGFARFQHANVTQ